MDNDELILFYRRLFTHQTTFSMTWFYFFSKLPHCLQVQLHLVRLLL